jgi:tetratricopeptide (TPR) repeat protein
MLDSFAAALMIVFRLLFCTLVSFAGALWILSAWFDRKISGREAGLLLIGLLGLMFIVVSLSLYGGLGMTLVVAVVLGATLLIRLLAAYNERRLDVALEERDIDTYRKRDDLERAIEHYEAALGLDPTLKPERYWIDRLQAEIERRGRRDISCPRCGTMRPANAATCPECGRWYSATETWAHTFRVMGTSRKAAWVAVGASALGAIAAVSVLVPSALKLMAVLAVVLAPAVAFAIGLQERRRAH